MTSRSEGSNAEVRAQLIIHQRSHEDTEHEDTRATLQLRDNASGLVFAEVYLNAQDLADLLSGTETGTVTDGDGPHGLRIAGTPAWIAPPELRTKLGLLPFHIMASLGDSGQIDDDLLDTWVETVRQEADAVTAQTSRRNDRQTYLTLRAYWRSAEAGERWRHLARSAVDGHLPHLPRKVRK